MDFQLVLVEREQPEVNKVRSSSGLLIDNKFVLLTCNLFVEENWNLIKEALRRFKQSSQKLCSDPFGNRNIPLNVIFKDDQGLYVIKQAQVLCAFLSESIRNSNQFIFKNWAIDSIDNNRDLQTALSLFVVLTLDSKNSLDDFRNSMKKWWDLIAHVHIHKCDAVTINSVPFADRNFMNTVSKGIVSNILGKNSCMILSDCPSAGGSEGSPVFSERLSSNSKYPVGIVISSISWWRGEWIGYTLIADIKSIIVEITALPVRLLNFNKELLHHNVVASSEFSLVQVYSKKNWGTAIVLDVEKGIFLTNSHVVDSEHVMLHYKGRAFKSIVIYKTPIAAGLDIAILKSKDIRKDEMKSVGISDKKFNIGDTVYSAGFSLFPKESRPSPTLSKGCISHYNPYMLRTTCAVHPGASGGAILDDEGALLGIIVCNTKLNESKAVFPRINMAIPFSAVRNDIFRYLETSDPIVLSNIHKANTEASIIWGQLDSKL